ncbi:MAG: hypothetical protein KDA28_16365 [Phycisphaerales bacterium]|nr:hypothetical protein [Phycisphaerales bacterium]
MSEASMPQEVAETFAPPTVTQFSVFLDNKVGKLYDLVEAFDQTRCRIVALDVHEAADHAVVRIITNNALETKNLLRKNSLPFSETELLVIELTRGHSLERLCLYLLGAELNIRFAYPLMLKPNGAPTIALAVDDLTLAGQILRRKEFKLLGECDLPNRNEIDD